MTNDKSETTNKPLKGKVWFIAGGTVLALVGLLVVGLQFKFAAAERAIKEMQLAAESSTVNPSIGKKWQWDRFPKETITASLQKHVREDRAQKISDGAERSEEVAVDDEVPDIEFDVVDVYQGLANVELDEGGNVVLDNKARESLEDAFSGLPDNMSEEDLHELQELVKIGLPGEAGFQTADILGRYYYYRLAQKDLPALHSATPSLDSALDDYDQLKALRYTYFGKEAAEKLYGEEHLMANYTIQAMKIESNKDISAEEKQKKLQALKTELSYLEGDEEEPAQQLDDVDADFQAKYSAFSTERSAIESAGLSQEQQQSEIDQLRTKYFSEDELEASFQYDERR
ncbi:hypothetical protein NBRC116494_33380 [Aurantivibrio plasticivorans]